MRLPEQPVPRVTGADVERIIRRDFGAELFAEALAILDQYDAKSGPPIPRIQLAVLKLAGGDLGALRSYMQAAKMDYRDVLAWAEYSGYFKNVSDDQEMPPHEIERIIDDDWKQYEAWLTG